MQVRHMAPESAVRFCSLTEDWYEDAVRFRERHWYANGLTPRKDEDQHRRVLEGADLSTNEE
jgi:hypothetical protein